MHGAIRFGLACLIFFLGGILAEGAMAQTQAPNCNAIASPPPMATLGGPATAGRGDTELGLAVGVFGEAPSSACENEIDLTGATLWHVRWIRGVTNRFDLGFDAEIQDHIDTLIGTTKFISRYQVTRGLRLEGGIGAADSGLGRSVNADLAATIGTRHDAATWNYYASLRVAGSHGCAGLFCTPESGSAPPPGAIVPLGIIGTTARVAESARFVMEAGLGGIFSREQRPGEGLYIHVSVGVLFNVGKKHS